MGMYHFFDDDVAMEVGVNGAILLTHIHYWVKKNRCKECFTFFIYPKVNPPSFCFLIITCNYYNLFIRFIIFSFVKS